MKITKAISKDFFNRIRDEEADNFGQLTGMLKEYPELVNGVVSGMSKGIDGFSSLMLSIRYYNFKFAMELIKAGADVNYIDISPARQIYNPVFFDLLEMLKDLIEVGKFADVKEGMLVWGMMESHGLDYSKQSIVDDDVNDSENCLEAFIRIASTKYGNKHKIHFESKYEPPAPYESTYILSEKSRDLEKEKWYELIAEKIVARMNDSLAKKMDANRHRDSGNVFETSPGKFELVDYFSLEVANKCIVLKFGHEINNMDDVSFMDDYKDSAEKTFRS